MQRWLVDNPVLQAPVRSAPNLACPAAATVRTIASIGFRRNAACDRVGDKAVTRVSAETSRQGDPFGQRALRRSTTSRS
jgi:hypothetical protein